MARGRIIDRSLIDSRKVNAISEGAELLWIRLIIITDDFGHYYRYPESIKGHVMTRRKTSLNVIEKRCLELCKIGLINTYQVKNEIFLEIVDFDKYQTFRKDRERKAQYPTPKTYIWKDGKQLSEVDIPTTTNDNHRLPVSKDKLSKDKLREGNVRQSLVNQIIEHLNQKTGKNFSLSSETTIKFLNGRINEGYVFENFQYVIDVKAEEWDGDPKMNRYLRPNTLFNRTNFENYLNEKKVVVKPKESWAERRGKKREAEKGNKNDT